MQVAVDPRHDKASPTGDAPRRHPAAIDDSGGGEVDWWVFEASSAISSVAATRGFALNRDLRQMRRPLPAARRSRVETRSFVIGRDEDCVARGEQPSVSDHAEQGGWTIETLRLRIAEPWFDPDGFRLYEQDGELAAFCWTKVHADDARVGEIYVIGVDPAFHGRGLGRELTLAGLDWMVDHGVTRSMLYVDGGNTRRRPPLRAARIRRSHRTDRGTCPAPRVSVDPVTRDRRPPTIRCRAGASPTCTSRRIAPEFASRDRAAGADAIASCGRSTSTRSGPSSHGR